jgi:hypothetical protein
VEVAKKTINNCLKKLTYAVKALDEDEASKSTL